VSKKYNARDIQVLSGCEAIRKRPGMYVGPLDDPTLLSRLVLEGCCIAFADAKAEKVKSIRIEVISDMDVRITDDGPGWPTEMRKGGKPIPVSFFQDLYACRDAKDPEDEGFCKIGISVANALSCFAQIEIRKQTEHEYFGTVEEHHEFDFTKGECLAHSSAQWSFKKVEGSLYPIGKTGTSLLFEFDETILKGAIDADYLREAVKGFACSLGIDIVVKDDRV
jgi:DNA gyrase/topoisomerase IV subunit B